MISWLNRHRLVMPLMAGGVFIVLLAGPFREDLLGWRTMAAAALLTAATVLAQTSMIVGEERAALLAMENCDPEPLLNFSRDMAKAYPPGFLRKGQFWLGMKLNEMAALCDLGRLWDAGQVLEEIAPRLEQMPEEMQVLVRINEAALRLMQKRPQDAKLLLESARADMAALPMREMQRKRWTTAIDNCWWDYRLQTGGASQELCDQAQRRFGRAQDLRSQVAARLCLAQCLTGLGRTEEARTHLCFVEENAGGMEQLRREAEEVRKQMRQREG